MSVSTKYRALALAVLIAVTTMGCAAARKEIVLRDDGAITKDVRDRLGADPSSGKIAVETKDGVVHLSGVVASDNVRNSAEQIARDTPGVRAVDNNVRFGVIGGAAPN